MRNFGAESAAQLVSGIGRGSWIMSGAPPPGGGARASFTELMEGYDEEKKVLDVREKGFGDIGDVEICVGVETVWAGGNTLTPTVFELLVHTLKVLDLSRNDLVSLDGLRAFEVLMVLDVSGNKLEKDQVLAAHPFPATLVSLDVSTNVGRDGCVWELDEQEEDVVFDFLPRLVDLQSGSGDPVDYGVEDFMIEDRLGPAA